MRALLAVAAVSTLLVGCASPAVDRTPDDGWTQVSPAIRVHPKRVAVEFEATSVIVTGFLEEFVCTVGTREHESLFAFDGKASEIHAALLLAGFIPGSPGKWREVESPDGSFKVEATAPRGDGVVIRVRLPDGSERPLEWFVRRAPIDGAAGGVGPPCAFVFAGSRFHTDRRTGIERYVADGSGSLVGLVTFGDETIAPVEVIPDQASAATPVWEAFSERMPEPGTKVRLVLTRSPASEKRPQ